MQPKTYIYSKLAFFHPIISGFHFTEKRKKLSSCNKTRNKRDNLPGLVFLGTNRTSPKAQTDCAGKPIQAFRHSPIGYFLSEIKT
ncbi:hypothetical protein HMPREF9442_00158 [Paraprevotella xylaniphila YIT 11841]|jgi:hypothetical protein|uniref:Uncharacterized protein n=1 Tax=Paraprevotella xylaniphila YIT 11841 TaxID=762982 RepID=F3QPS1_9BACT|nr:hypothetical protein HMPREF9442_00158 [Paraprevotella xylaniphila YIT 11841]